MATLVIDVETTGIPTRPPMFGQYYDYKMTNMYDSSRIVSIAWIVLDQNMNHVSNEHYIIKPSYFIIPKQSTAIHKISHEDAIQNGIPLQDVADKLLSDVRDNKCMRVVAHNLNFDMSILFSELHRISYFHLITLLSTMKMYCTMRNGKRLLMPNKYPKLKELYHLCFQKDLDNPHNALCDAEACAHIYVHLRGGAHSFLFYS